MLQEACSLQVPPPRNTGSSQAYTYITVLRPQVKFLAASLDTSSGPDRSDLASPAVWAASPRGEPLPHGRLYTCIIRQIAYLTSAHQARQLKVRRWSTGSSHVPDPGVRQQLCKIKVR